MTGPLGNSEFCFVSGNIEILGKQNSLFPSGPVIKCLILIILFLKHLSQNLVLKETLLFNSCWFVYILKQALLV